MTKRMEGKRSFKMVNSTFGILAKRLVASDPMKAGKNGGVKLFRMMSKDPKLAAKFKSTDHVIVELHEITRAQPESGSSTKDKIFFYKITRTPLKKGEDMAFKEAKFQAKWDYKVESVRYFSFPKVSQRGGYYEDIATASDPMAPSPSPSDW